MTTTESMAGAKAAGEALAAGDPVDAVLDGLGEGAVEGEAGAGDTWGEPQPASKATDSATPDHRVAVRMIGLPGRIGGDATRPSWDPALAAPECP
ncbi:MAG: hypothetical protein ABI562_01105 [Chloroflexota bacterium]